MFEILFSQTVILDLSKPGISKNGRSSSILGPKEKETLFMQLKTFFYVKQIHVSNFQRKGVPGNL